MKKTIAIAAVVLSVLGFSMIAFSETKRPTEMTKSEKIQKNLKDAKEQAKKEAEEKAKEQEQSQET